MTALGHELRLVQNSALGAVLLWRFARSYSDAHPFHAPAPFALSAIILPMVWLADTISHIGSTQIGSGLRALADRLGDAQLDVLLALHDRAALWRGKTCAALRLGLGAGIFRLSSEAGLIASDTSWVPNAQTQAVRTQTAAAEKVGTWFASLTMREISLTLHIRF